MDYDNVDFHFWLLTSDILPIVIANALFSR